MKQFLYAILLLHFVFNLNCNRHEHFKMRQDYLDNPPRNYTKIKTEKFSKRIFSFRNVLVCLSILGILIINENFYSLNHSYILIPDEDNLENANNKLELMNNNNSRHYLNWNEYSDYSEITVSNYSEDFLTNHSKYKCSNKTDVYFVNKFQRTNLLKHDFPPYLISYGGSGNTFTRLILEYITTFFTGSIYDSRVLKEKHKFMGESICDPRVLTVKIHPHGIRLIKGTVENKGYLLLNGTNPCTGSKRIEKIPGKYKYSIDNYVKNKPAFSVYLIRNPWAASFALFNLEGYRKSQQKNYLKSPHIHIIPKLEFDINQFMNFLNRRFYQWSWTMKFLNIHKKILKNIPNRDKYFTVIKYENLLDTSVRNKEMFNLINFFVRINSSDYKSYKNKISCVWSIIENDFRANSVHRKYDKKTHIDINFAYDSLSVNFICFLWEKIKIEAELFGYFNWRKIICDPCSL